MRRGFSVSTAVVGTFKPGVLLQAAFNPSISPPHRHGMNPKTSLEAYLAGAAAVRKSIFVG
ncbi:MAG TPA: hypothetical protein PLL20_08140 [Phycisphaerae bacterium]|nr:hypothetical protein [Phycisphaerae bacterium]HRR84370.1 hypothetical protein [Phycisphaerae bacterium]